VAQAQAMQVVMCEPAARVPQEILETVQRHVEDMSRALAQFEPESPFWNSLRESGLSVEVLGWKFTFVMEPDKLVLIDAEPVPPTII
jgi:hypothetical protein